MIGVEIVKDQATREVAGAWRDAIVELAFKRGLLILGCGETSFRLAPPLIVNKYEAMIALDILEECIEAVGAVAGALARRWLPRPANAEQMLGLHPVLQCVAQGGAI